jgi:hypothetical protein
MNQCINRGDGDSAAPPRAYPAYHARSVPGGRPGPAHCRIKENPMTDKPVHDGSNVALTATEARQGRTTGRVRWILGISLVLVVVAMAVVLLVG